MAGSRFAVMAGRRTLYEPLKTAALPRWLVVRDQYRALIGCQCVAPGVDLKVVLLKALADHIDEGWIPEEFSSQTACAFVHRGAERRQISLEPFDPRRRGVYPHAKTFK